MTPVLMPPNVLFSLSWDAPPGKRCIITSTYITMPLEVGENISCEWELSETLAAKVLLSVLAREATQLDGVRSWRRGDGRRHREQSKLRLLKRGEKGTC